MPGGRSSDGAVDLCRYHAAVLITRCDGPYIYVPSSIWEAAQGRRDLAVPLVSREVGEWCAEPRNAV